MIFFKTKVFDVLNSKKQEPKRHTRNFEYGFFFLNMEKKFKTENINTPYQKPVYRLEDAY